MDGSIVYASLPSKSHPKYTIQNVNITEFIPLEPGKGYIFSIKDTYGDGLMVSGPNVILSDGLFGEGKILKRFFGNWGKKRKVRIWLPRYKTKRAVGRSCSEHLNCYSEKCAWGKCRRRESRQN